MSFPYMYSADTRLNQQSFLHDPLSLNQRKSEVLSPIVHLVPCAHSSSKSGVSIPKPDSLPDSEILSITVLYHSVLTFQDRLQQEWTDVFFFTNN